MLRLYRAPFSTNVERVTLALAHKGLEVESVVISYSDRSPVLEVSGQPLVPVLVDGDEVIPDSVRILRHLEERWPDPPLFPRDPARRAELDVFLEWFNEVWKLAPNAIEEELEGDEPDHERVAAPRRAHARVTRPLRGHARRPRPPVRRLLGSRLRGLPVPEVRDELRDPADDELFHRILDEHLHTDGHPRLSAWIDRVNERSRHGHEA